MSKLYALIFLVAVGVVGLVASTGAQPKGQKPGHSSFYRDFDPTEMLGVAELAPKSGTGVRGHTGNPPPEKHEFKIFHIDDMPAAKIDEALKGLKARFVKLVRANKAVMAEEPTDAIRERPIYLLCPNLLAPGEWVQPGKVRGFSFAYREGKVRGAVDVVAVPVGPEKPRWVVVGAVHEPAP
jgi:hypothetical protein